MDRFVKKYFKRKFHFPPYFLLKENEKIYVHYQENNFGKMN